MFFCTLLTCLVAFVEFGIAGYVLKDDYSPSSFFGMMDFFTDADPTHGHGMSALVAPGTARGDAC